MPFQSPPSRKLHSSSNFDLWKLTLRPEASSKTLRIVLIVKILETDSSHINKVSSANCNMQHSVCALPTFTSFNTFSFNALRTRLANPSATIRNKKGAKGSPCLRPLKGLNSYVGLSLIKTDTVADSRQPCTHLIHLLWNPILCNISKKKLHLTESYAFSKSTFKKTPLLRHLRTSSITSLPIRTLSNIPLPFRKADWVSSITKGKTFLILCDIALVMILYIALTREIGLNWSIITWSFTLGTRAINDALQPFGKIPHSWKQEKKI